MITVTYTCHSETYGCSNLSIFFKGDLLKPLLTRFVQPFIGELIHRFFLLLNTRFDSDFIFETFVGYRSSVETMTFLFLLFEKSLYCSSTTPDTEVPTVSCNTSVPVVGSWISLLPWNWFPDRKCHRLFVRIH